jgi:hypothetical protein
MQEPLESIGTEQCVWVQKEHVLGRRLAEPSVDAPREAEVGAVLENHVGARPSGGSQGIVLRSVVDDDEPPDLRAGAGGLQATFDLAGRLVGDDDDVHRLHVRDYLRPGDFGKEDPAWR